MLKKILIILSALMLVSCADKPIEEPQKEYIDPQTDIFIFGELDETNKAIIKKANGNKDYKNNQFKMLNKDVYSNDLIDIDGNKVNFKDFDKFVLEVVSTTCEHCHKMIEEHLDEMLERGITLVQYFNNANDYDVREFYNDLNREIPNNLIVISRDEQLYEYLHDYLVLESYPTLISYVDSKVTFNKNGDISTDELNAYYEVSFNNILANDEKINNVIAKCRTREDVKNSLSKENLEKINNLDNDSHTLDFTLNIIGKKLDFDRISNDKSSVYINEIDSYDEYKESDLVLLYTHLGSDEDISKINYINKLVNSNDKVKYIVVLVEGLESSSNIYKDIEPKFVCPVVSVLGYIPNDFYTIGFRNYPSALFVEKGTFVGAYSNINSIDNFNKAIDMFIGDNSIALIDNN